MKHSPVTARIIIVYTDGNTISTAMIEDIYGRRRPLFSCAHRQVVEKIAQWTEFNHFDQSEIRCEHQPASETADASNSP